MPRSRPLRALLLTAFLAALLAFASRSGALQALAEIVLSGHNLPAVGTPVAATHAKLSEHEREALAHLPPQAQAERLLSAAVNHDDGATRMILERVESWRGHLKRTKAWTALVDETALYSNDLRVRAAAIEADLASYGAEKTPAEAERWMEAGRQSPESRPFSAWVLGLLGNRGVETERIHGLLREWARDPDEEARYWAVEGLAMLGIDAAVPDLLEALKSDPAARVRERGGCGLSKSGMLTREQRLQAVPGLIDVADDPAVEPLTRTWAFQALREITGERLRDDAQAWRGWYAGHGEELAARLRDEDARREQGER